MVPKDRKPNAAGIVRTVGVDPLSRRVWTLEETRKQELAVEQLLLAGYNPPSIPSTLRKQEDPALHIGKARTRTIVNRVRAQWAKHDAEVRPTNRAMQERRLLKCIRDASGFKDKNGRWIERPNHNALVGYEKLLADLQGTREPVRVDVNVQVNETILHVISGMGAEQVAASLARIRERDEMAAAYRAQQLPRKTG